jgi:hypothetical protein
MHTSPSRSVHDVNTQLDGEDGEKTHIGTKDLSQSLVAPHLPELDQPTLART